MGIRAEIVQEMEESVMSEYVVHIWLAILEQKAMTDTRCHSFLQVFSAQASKPVIAYQQLISTE